jgi:hypothetical protein
MGNPAQVHEQIVSNIVAPLHTAMKPKGCSAFGGNMRIQASDDSSNKNKFKPDVMVRYGPIIPSNYVTGPDRDRRSLVAIDDGPRSGR